MVERGIGDFGQSSGITAIGLLLMRIVDPKGDTPAFEGFGYKQLVYKAFLGGGLVTALSVSLIYQFGAIPFLIFCDDYVLNWSPRRIAAFWEKIIS
ncbi:hypothetical protein [Virgibacillus proomii]|uniref:hypothetical protein n=1 Tax=Virgibacillus proomii TaxID=84407 RepID=UPI001C103609|nr:hypothetical protein [Virgibacillus proomii]MBU5266456.1 hypothetical protein [Virgibacillus proomii]